MKMTRMSLVIVALLLLARGLRAESELAQFAQQYEEKIQERVEKERVPMRRQQTELALRQNYTYTLLKKRDDLLRSGQLVTDEVVRLRAKREALIAELNALSDEILEASKKAPEILELQAIEEANLRRIKELQRCLTPDNARETDAAEVTP